MKNKHATPTKSKTSAPVKDLKPKKNPKGGFHIEVDGQSGGYVSSIRDRPKVGG